MTPYLTPLFMGSKNIFCIAYTTFLLKTFKTWGRLSFYLFPPWYKFNQRKRRVVAAVRLHLHCGNKGVALFFTNCYVFFVCRGKIWRRIDRWRSRSSKNVTFYKKFKMSPWGVVLGTVDTALIQNDILCKFKEVIVHRAWVIIAVIVSNCHTKLFSCASEATLLDYRVEGQFWFAHVHRSLKLPDLWHRGAIC